LARHAAVHLKEKYCCPVCNKRFNTVVKLESHELMHSRTGEYVCETCNKSFSTARLLARHNNTHVRTQGNIKVDGSAHEVSFVCSQCGCGFNDCNLLEEHMSNFH
jgi:transcriptional regulator NrdR family protein